MHVFGKLELSVINKRPHCGYGQQVTGLAGNTLEHYRFVPALVEVTPNPVESICHWEEFYNFARQEVLASDPHILRISHMFLESGYAENTR